MAVDAIMSGNGNDSPTLWGIILGSQVTEGVQVSMPTQVFDKSLYVITNGNQFMPSGVTKLDLSNYLIAYLKERR